MGKIDKRKIKSICIILLTIFLIIAIILDINSAIRKEKFPINKGKMDLSDWDINKDGNLRLDGEWEFYPNQLLSPAEIGSNSITKPPLYIKVPGSWRNTINNDGSVEGAGTYRLKIKLPKDGQYAIKTSSIRLSSKTYINGEERGKVGQVSLNREGFQPNSKYIIATGESINKEIEIIIQVSSFGLDQGGIVRTIKFGTSESIIKNNNRIIAMEVFIIAMLIVAGIILFVQYLINIDNLYLFYFAIASFLTAIHFSTKNNQVLSLIFDYSFFTRMRIQTITIVLISLIILKAISILFEKFSNNKIVNILTIINIIFLTIFLIDYNNLSFFTNNILKILTILVYMINYLYILTILIKAAYNKVESSEYIPIIIYSFILYWLILAIRILFEIYLQNLEIMIMLLLILSLIGMTIINIVNKQREKIEMSNKIVQYYNQRDRFLINSSNMMLHSINNINNIVKSLLEGKDGVLNKEQHKNLISISEIGQRLIYWAKDIVKVSENKRQEEDIKLGVIDIYKEVEELLEETKLFIPENKKIKIMNLIEPSCPKIVADKEMIEKIINNILENSIKYTEEGNIRLSAKVIDKMLEIKIEDTGIGIKKEEIEDIFDPFYFNKIKKEEKSSIGLGLFIAQKLVNIQGGEIKVDSEYGVGTAFYFTMPICTKTEEELALGTIPIPNKEKIESINKEYKKLYSKDKETILIIGKNPIETGEILGLKDYNIILNYNGENILTKIKEEKIDLIIADFILESISIKELCKKIREQYTMMDLPIIILVSTFKSLNLTKNQDCYINDFVKKPVDKEELFSKVQSLLAMKNTVKEGLKQELQYFSSQISPHFLYNTINTIIGISYVDEEKARKALYNLATYFRGKLDIYKDDELIALEAEIKLVKAYLEIEQLRYGNMLEINYNIENIEGMIPPLTIQPIIENSIKYCIKDEKNTCRINLSIKNKKDGNIKVIVEDNGIGMSEEQQKELLEGRVQGLGFRNINKKLSLLKGAKLDLYSQQGKGTRIEINIPHIIKY